MPGAAGREGSPFHEGERQVQERFGVREKIERFADKVIRDHMPDQHRDFYSQLPFLLVGTVDGLGRPWASILAGRPGFLSAPDDRTLEVAARPLPGDPLDDTLVEGADIGVLGIQPETRRRNRLTGRVAARRADGFAIAIKQSFGNCPQYIQTREIELLPEIDAPAADKPTVRSDRFDDRTRALIERSDTLFVATVYSADAGDAAQGADASHRGGKPGFVRVEDESTFVFPDFAGNYHFNTVGNILLNPRAGFLFVDFETGDLAYMTGAAEIVWEGEQVRAFAGAEQLIRFRLEESVYVEGSLPLRLRFGEYSPLLERTGSWEQAHATIEADRERNAYQTYEVFDKRRESDTIASFYLRRADGKGLPSYEPGQFLPIRLSVPGREEPASRTYTVSVAPGAGHYRLSVKREGGEALVSNHLHDRVEVGDRIEAMAPRGRFVLDRSSDRPVVLISAGVGITPMIAMADWIVAEGRRTRTYRRSYFIHGARNGREHAFGANVRQLAAEHDAVTAHIRYSAPTEDDRLGETHDSEGRVDLALLKQVLPLDDYDYYLCGPAGFMAALYDGLTGLGVRKERIRYESFGPATVLGAESAAGGPADGDDASKGPVQVRFAKSEIEAEWTPEKGTLLDLAESVGLRPDYSCRSGICGTCATKVSCGSVDYLEEPSAPYGEDEVLTCCSTPRSGSGPSSCGTEIGLVLEL